MEKIKEEMEDKVIQLYIFQSFFLFLFFIVKVVLTIGILDVCCAVGNSCTIRLCQTLLICLPPKRRKE